MIQTNSHNNEKVFVLKTDQGRYNFYDNFLVKTALTSPHNSELRPELNFYIQPTSSHSLQGFQLKPCAGSYRISKVLIINSSLCANSSIHSNLERISDSRVKAKNNNATQQSSNSDNKKEFQSQSCPKRWKFGKPCNVWPKCTNNSGFSFVIKKNKSQNCPGISSQENQQDPSEKTLNTTCYALKVGKEIQNSSKVLLEKNNASPKSTNTSCEHMKYDNCPAKISKKVTFDLTSTKTKSNENFLPCKSSLRRCKNSLRALKCNFALSAQKAIFSKLGQPPEGPVGILRNVHESWHLKVNYGCSDFRERLMREVQRDETRHVLGFPLKDSLESHNMYPFVN